MTSEQYQKRQKTKKPLIIAIAAVAVLAIAGVLIWQFSSSKPQKASSVSIGLRLEPTNLNIRETAGVALDQILLDNVYEGLVSLAPGKIDEFIPVLAKELPEVSTDAKTYTFTLRDGVTFHSGSALTADDVVTSLSEKLTEDRIGSAATITAPDPTTITIELDEPNSQLMWFLAGREGIVLEAAATNDLSNTANGTGPFTLEEWRQNDSVTLAKNPKYWGEGAKVDTAVFRFIPDPRASVNALREGELDVLLNLQSTLRDELSKNPDVSLVRADGTDVFTLVYNQRKAPFDDLRVRQALSMAIDTEALIRAQNGDGKPLGGPITELEPGYADLTGINAYNPDRAKQLLREAGQDNLSLTITAPNHYPQATLDIISSQLQQIGVSVKIDSVEFSAWLDTVYSNHDFDLSYVDHAEARDFGNYVRDNYYYGYDSQQTRDLYQRALRATDAEQADKLLQQAAEQVAQDAPAKWLFNYTPTLVVRNTVEGFPTANTNSRVPLGNVSNSE